ncbi:hypothetical protein DL93DRAFT_1676997 [Clavulina sp. PMI_390]|nr:hypothetical protein DL93DRAFT_1676997 [Clavulina sp. PMI_390]
MTIPGSRSAEVIGFLKNAQLRDLLHHKVRYLFALSFVGISFRIYRYDISTQHMMSSPSISQYEISGLDDALRRQHVHHILTQSGYTWLLAVFFSIYLQLGAMSGEEKVPKLPSEPFPSDARTLAAFILTEDEEEASRILANMSPGEYQELSAQPNENPATEQESISSITSVTSNSSDRPETPPPHLSGKGISNIRDTAHVSSRNRYDGDHDEVGRVLDSHDELSPPYTSDDHSRSLISANDSILVAVGDSPPRSISPPSTPPRTTIPQLTSIFDSLTLTPDEPNHVQARTRLHQNILQSGTSPIRDNTLGVHKHHHSDVPGLPMIKASASSPALLKTSVQPAPSKEDEDL